MPEVAPPLSGNPPRPCQPGARTATGSIGDPRGDQGCEPGRHRRETSLHAVVNLPVGERGRWGASGATLLVRDVPDQGLVTQTFVDEAESSGLMPQSWYFAVKPAAAMFGAYEVLRNIEVALPEMSSFTQLRVPPGFEQVGVVTSLHAIVLSASRMTR